MISALKTPVVVLRSVEHGPLGILRSLGRLRVPVYVVESDPWSAAAFSRYCSGRFRGADDRSEARELLATLGRVARQIKQSAVLIPTSDATATFVAEHAAHLSNWFLFPQQDPCLVRSLASKKEMYFLAQRHGIATAESFFPQSRADVVSFLRSAVFPVVLKGIDVMRLWRAAGRRMFIVHSRQELLEVYDAIPASEKLNLLLQEYIPGADDTVWMFNGYFNRDSQCLFGSTARKLRQCPVYSGVSSLGISQKNEVVDHITRSFMQAIGYRGALDIEYKHDPRDGRYKLLDANPRIGASFRLLVAADGTDVARVLYQDLTGQPVTAAPPLEGRKWMVEDLDTVSCLRYRKDGRLQLRAWANSFRGVRESAYFAADDPLPLLPMLVVDAKKAFVRMVKRLRPAQDALSRIPRNRIPDLPGNLRQFPRPPIAVPQPAAAKARVYAVK